jgi:hypothetical protein
LGFARSTPDARFVAYSVRSTDWDGNHGFNALWVLDRGNRRGLDEAQAWQLRRIS